MHKLSSVPVSSAVGAGGGVERGSLQPSSFLPSKPLLPSLSILQEQLYAGGCNQTYVVLGNYCNLTCGRCTSVKGARTARASAGAPAPTASAAAGPLAA